ncbi:hypothetical protein GCM10009839_06030 [Catenulispora yoronensis]|uniref:Pyrrolo-quinoline quinone repeat domain-containing protein n=2 Tax=Catenulispora yoronensis TaxID=450799 RepID=A0ABN2TM81_9ACTN
MAAVLATMAMGTAAGCSGSSTRADSRPAISTVSTVSTASNTSNASNTSTASTAGVSAVRLDGAVYGRPADGGTQVFAATENNTVYALSPTDGSVKWSKHLAAPFRPHGCGNIVPLGITGAPVYDPDSHLVYVVTEDPDAKHVLYGLAASDGHVVSQVEVDAPVGDRAFLQQRPALTLWHGHVFAVFGGLAGDCGDYTGAVASVDTATGSVHWFEASTSGRGGMWAPGAPGIGDDRLYFSIGNGNADKAGEPFDGTDSVVALDENAQRVDLFAPTSWAADNANDADLGSMNPALAAGHVIIAGKSGQGYLLDPEHLATTTPTTFPACAAFGAAAVDGDVVYLPCADGTRAFRISAQPTALWHAPKANGQPVLSNGRIWVTDWDDGELYALDPATGATDRRFAVGTLPHFATPTVVGAKLFLGTTDGVAIVTP